MNRIPFLFFFLFSLPICAQLVKLSQADVIRFKIKSETQTRTTYKNGNSIVNNDTTEFAFFDQWGTDLVHVFSVNAKKVVLDEKGRVIKSCLGLDSTLYKYDENGNQVETKCYHYPDKECWTTKRKYGEQGLLLEELEFVDDTVLINSTRYFPKARMEERVSLIDGQIHILQYNAKHQLIQVKSCNREPFLQSTTNGISGEIWHAKADKWDTRQTNFRFDYGKKSIWANLFVTYTIAYNPNGVIGEEKWFDDRDSLIRYSKYDSKGNWTEECFVHDSFLKREIISRDTVGKTIVEIEMNDGKMGKKTTFSYWDNDSVKTESVLFYALNLENDSTFLESRSITYYDRLGRKTNTRKTTHDTTLFEYNYAYEYNSANQLLSFSTFRANDSIIPESQVIFMYDKNGLLTKRSEYFKGKIRTETRYTYTYY